MQEGWERWEIWLRNHVSATKTKSKVDKSDTAKENLGGVRPRALK
jgi:hypothetical protein